MGGYLSVDGFDANGSRYTNGSAAVADTDLVTLAQAKALLQALQYKQANVAATSNVNIASAPATFDGQTPAAGWRVMLAFQTDGTQNGLYVWNGAGSAMTRTQDANTGPLLANAVITVDQGTAYGDKVFKVTNDTITIGTTAVVLVQVPASVGTARPTPFDQTVAAAAGPYTYPHNQGQIPITLQLWQQISSKWYPIASGNLSADATNIYLTLPSTPAANTYRVTASV